MGTKEMFCTLVGAYYGIRNLDEYPLKEYILEKLEQKIRKYVKEHSEEYEYSTLAEEVEKIPFKNQLQDCLIILPRLDVSMEVIFLIKQKLIEIGEES